MKLTGLEKRSRLLLVVATLGLSLLACALYTPRDLLNNQIRLAIYDYELQTRGPVDDLVIHFRRDEPRVKFEGQNEAGGRTVWLYQLGAQEFFETRPPERSYLYIREIEYNPTQTEATVQIYRGDGSGYEGHQLTLVKTGQEWKVNNEVTITAEP